MTAVTVHLSLLKKEERREEGRVTLSLLSYPNSIVQVSEFDKLRPCQREENSAREENPRPGPGGNLEKAIGPAVCAAACGPTMKCGWSVENAAGHSASAARRMVPITIS
jgi:hypothetical protein